MFIHFQFLQGTTILYRTCYGGRGVYQYSYERECPTSLELRWSGDETRGLLASYPGARLGVYLPVAEEGV